MHSIWCATATSARSPRPLPCSSRASRATGSLSSFSLTLSSGDLIAAGTNAPFAIYIWSLRTGKLLDTLTGHEGPISCLQFNHRGTQLASGSWDHTVRTWDLLGSGLKESLNHPAEIVSLDWRRDDKELIASCLNGSVYIWNPADGG